MFRDSPDVAVTDTPSRKISYPVVRTSSVAAVHFNVKLLTLTNVALKPVGADGAVVSGNVATTSGADCSDQFAAASRARTVIV